MHRAHGNQDITRREPRIRRSYFVLPALSAEKTPDVHLLSTALAPISLADYGCTFLRIMILSEMNVYLENSGLEIISVVDRDFGRAHYRTNGRLSCAVATTYYVRRQKSHLFYFYVGPRLHVRWDPAMNEFPMGWRSPLFKGSDRSTYTANRALKAPSSPGRNYVLWFDWPRYSSRSRHRWRNCSFKSL